MKLTGKNKAFIDSLSYEELLTQWRFAPIGNKWFQGETGDYWHERMMNLRGQIGNDKAADISKEIGWQRSER